MPDKKTPARFSESFMYIQELFQTDEPKNTNWHTKLARIFRIIIILIAGLAVIACLFSAIYFDLSSLKITENGLSILLR